MRQQRKSLWWQQLVEALLDGVQQRQVRGLLLERQRLGLELLERQDELLGLGLQLEQQRLAWPQWHRRNRQRP